MAWEFESPYRTTALLGQLKGLIVEQDITKLALLLTARLEQEGAQLVPYSTLQHLASLRGGDVESHHARMCLCWGDAESEFIIKMWDAVLWVLALSANPYKEPDDY